MKNTQRFIEIDWLRGSACLFVVAFHYLSQGPRAGWITNASFPEIDLISKYGYLGVHLFFIISGFVILLSAEGATTRSFLASRIARLYPAFLACASITALALWVSEDIRFQISAKNYFANLTMFAHWFDIPYIDGAYWSLAVELHFYIYIIIALILGWNHRFETLLAAWLAISAINALRPMWPLEFWLNARWAPFFIAGGIFYIIRQHGICLSRLLTLIAAYGLAIFYTVCEAERLSTRISVQPSVSAIIITIFFVIFSLIAFRIWSMRDSFIASWVGAMTYPVYLLHQNFGYILYEQFIGIIEKPAIALTIIFTVVLSLAWLVHIKVEKSTGPWLKNLLSNN